MNADFSSNEIDATMSELRNGRHISSSALQGAQVELGNGA